MNGKEYVLQTIKLGEDSITVIRDSGTLGGDSLLEGMGKACKNLDVIKNKPTLRTKSGAHLAFPVYDAIQNLQEEWEDSKDGNEFEELKARMEDFIASVTALVESLKDRTVIMT